MTLFKCRGSLSEFVLHVGAIALLEHVGTKLNVTFLGRESVTTIEFNDPEVANESFLKIMRMMEATEV